VGKDGKLFWILKFRSMIDGGERMGNGITPGDDPRVTRIGAFLRKWKLDELPQLWNVLKGEMSLVGPRPELPSYVAEYTPEQKAVLRVKPGITDSASLRYRDEGRVLQQSADPELFYRQKILPDKLSLNLQYLKDVSFAHDLSLMLSTVKSVVRFSQTIERE
jgi:lipopolysaccharide/colanic/teichoic acid biosynthesis glycosyltransferase